MSVKPNFSGKDLPFVFKGDKLVYPNPVKDGLVLWYDFAGMRNTDANREIAKDLSDNGNHGALQNFNYTEESGYGKNRLLFDGVDDRLQIPELSLDETGMTVGMDGKVYAYEDDKMISVGEGGIEAKGRNLLVDSTKHHNGDKWLPYGYAWNFHFNFDMKQGQTYTVSVPVFNPDEERDSNSRIYIENLGNSIKSISPRENTLVTRTFTAGQNQEEVLVRFLVNGSNFPRLLWGWPKLEKGSVATPWTPAPEDFQATSLSPSSLSNLQLYNRPLRKNEMLQNAESEGLKELKEGVPVQDGLVLHYDFSNESNTSEYREKAFDYSGNGNHGTLKNFNFTAESGYNGGRLIFDGIDDYVGEVTNRIIDLDVFEDSLAFTVKVKEGKRNNLLYAQEDLKIDLWGGSIRRSDMTPSIRAERNILNEVVSIYMVRDGTRHLTYVNGEIVDDVAYTNSRPLRFNNIGFYVPDGRPNIELYDVKIYNRSLTPEEIAHNYAIEKERFGIE